MTYASALGQAIATWSEGQHITHDIYLSLLDEGWCPEEVASMQSLHYRPTKPWIETDETDDGVAVRGVN